MSTRWQEPSSREPRFSHLRLWFKAVAYMAVTRCGISSRQLSRDLGVGVKTGWRMFHQIRKVLAEDTGVLEGDIEVDETYIGGKAANMHRDKREKIGGRGTAGKTPVFGMVERKGRVRAKVVDKTDAQTLIPEIRVSVDKDAAIITDGMASYRDLGRLGYQHDVVPHSEGIYVIGKDIHTNSIEVFWSQLKRSIDGSYHHVTTHHLQKYVDEYALPLQPPERRTEYVLDDDGAGYSSGFLTGLVALDSAIITSSFVAPGS